MNPDDVSTLAGLACNQRPPPLALSALPQQRRAGYAMQSLVAMAAALAFSGSLQAQTVPAGQVCFYEHIDYGGASVCVSASMVFVPDGWNDQASSVRIAPDLRLEMFEHRDFQGTKLTHTGNVPNFVNLNFNDTLSSFRILPTGGAMPPAPAPAPTFTTGGIAFNSNPCATENGVCTFTGSRNVAYGANGSFTVKTVTGPADCNNSVFGDPLVGTFKACYLQAGTVVLPPPPPPPAPQPQPCAASTTTPLRWTVGSATCEALPRFTTSGTAATLIDGSDPTRGSAAFTCTNGTWGAANAATCVDNTPAPVPPPPPPPPTATPTAKTDAARLLIQATYGPTMDEIDRTASIGPAAWITDQFSTPSMDNHWDYVMVRKGPIGCNPCKAQYINATMESFWYQAVKGPDQLRQRTVFGLSEIFVISTVNSSLEIQEDAHASYLDMLSRNAFGNYRTLIEQVSTHPAMAHYLSHMRNQKEDPVSGRIPDENYAREVMQLFTIGLWQLNPDGSRKKDGNGKDIPTYNQSDVMGLAKVFTGWSWSGPNNDNWHGWGGSDWKNQLKNFPEYHSTSEKRFLGTVVPANTSGPQSMKIAMDTLFNHPNVGPFIGSQLIKRFVTSNPTPAYVGRVAAAFNNNGAGVRGDMKAVIRAVLMDTEARDNSQTNNPEWGKLREPMVRLGTWLRTFNAGGPNNLYDIWNLEDLVSSIGQNPLRAPSVFNWYRPSYAPPGEILRRGLTAPEFQITHETTVTGYANFVRNTVERGMGPEVQPNYAPELALANNPAALMDRLNLMLVAGRMTPATRQTILDAVNAFPASDARQRVHTAITLTMLSPEFIVQK